MAKMWSGTYRRDTPLLENKHALLMAAPFDEAWVIAQFDDLSLPQAYGWHSFPAGDFLNDPPIDWTQHPTEIQDPNAGGAGTRRRWSFGAVYGPSNGPYPRTGGYTPRHQISGDNPRPGAPSRSSGPWSLARRTRSAR